MITACEAQKRYKIGVVKLNKILSEFGIKKKQVIVYVNCKNPFGGLAKRRAISVQIDEAQLEKALKTKEG